MLTDVFGWGYCRNLICNRRHLKRAIENDYGSSITILRQNFSSRG
ncbi:hypothetical protein HMPREF0541_00665 [Lacticaseibacillus rhamnosus ATCC 21052]|nr:hypothetical protein HMPREF0541_00665 [Lacticaseibacillus rhamnosus ATCC 21052]